jgi:hypothetical protein
MAARVTRVACFAAVISFFPEAVTAATPAHIAITGGNNQAANIGVQFGVALQVKVTDSANGAVSGADVVFTVNTGTLGASGTLTNSGGTSSSSSVTASTNSSGVASIVATANSTAGGWTVTASVSGVSATPSFALTNNSPFVIASNLPGNDGLALAFASSQALAVGFQVTTSVLFSSATLRLNAIESMPCFRCRGWPLSGQRQRCTRNAARDTIGAECLGAQQRRLVSGDSGLRLSGVARGHSHLRTDILAGAQIIVNEPPPEGGGSRNGLKALFRPKAGRMVPVAGARVPGREYFM